jgi:LmbE family N-acetylglucosaminyl deacetylase
VLWVVLAASGDRADEARRSAELLLGDAAESSVDVLGFRDGYLPHTASDVKDAFEELKARVRPDLVLTHTRDDLHQDHRLVCELTWNTFRDHVVLEYEIPKWDGDTGRPNVYVALEEAVVQQKLDLLGAHFETQRGKDWYYAEAFVARKLTLVPGGVA